MRLKDLMKKKKSKLQKHYLKKNELLWLKTIYTTSTIAHTSIFFVKLLVVRVSETKVLQPVVGTAPERTHTQLSAMQGVEFRNRLREIQISNLENVGEHCQFQLK